VPLVVAGTACAGLLAAALPTASAAAAPQPGSSAAAAAASLGVIVSPDGWLHYTHLLSSTLTLTHSTTVTVAAGRGADGSCIVADGPVGPTASSAEHFQEEVALNPATCQERILSGLVDASDLARLDGAAAAAAPSATSYQSAHVKTAWIDPLNITITSLADNLRWPLYGAGGTLTARVNPYEFKYDGWSSTGPLPIRFTTLSGNVGWSVRETDHFTNTDFASFVYVVFGVAGWLACGAPLTATAHFNHDVTVYGYRSGARNRAWNDTATGACVDLVHHAEWDGYGWVS
jgi:hypothetical protein